MRDVKGVKDTLRFERGGYTDTGGFCSSIVCGLLQGQFWFNVSCSLTSMVKVAIRRGLTLTFFYAATNIRWHQITKLQNPNYPVSLVDISINAKASQLLSIADTPFLHNEVTEILQGITCKKPTSGTTNRTWFSTAAQIGNDTIFSEDL
jgi:hypothetical protein